MVTSGVAHAAAAQWEHVSRAADLDVWAGGWILDGSGPFGLESLLPSVSGIRRQHLCRCRWPRCGTSRLQISWPSQQALCGRTRPTQIEEGLLELPVAAGSAGMSLGRVAPKGSRPMRCWLGGEMAAVWMRAREESRKRTLSPALSLC